MKYLNLLLLTIGLMLCSCNHNEPPLEITLPISETFIPSSIKVDPNTIDEEQKRLIIHLSNNGVYIVNDASEFPDDPIGFGGAYNKINFKQSTLLVEYLLHDYSMDTYNNRFYRNTKEKTYNWVVNIGTASDLDIDTDDLQFTRFAILVNKMPADAELKTWYGVTHFGWFPEE